MRLAIADGKRCTAGFARNTSSSASGVIAAIAPASSAAEPALQRRRTAERPLHRHLLVEQHPDEERERIVDEQPVGDVVAGDGERDAGHAAQRTRTVPERAGSSARAVDGGTAISRS